MKLTLFTISNEQIKEQLSKLQTKVDSLETVKDVQDKIISAKDSQITFLQGEISSISNWVVFVGGAVIALASAAFIFIKLLENKAKKKIADGEEQIQLANRKIDEADDKLKQADLKLEEINNINTIAQEKINGLYMKLRFDIRFNSIKTKLDNLAENQKLHLNTIPQDIKEEYDEFVNYRKQLEQDYKIQHFRISELILTEQTRTEEDAIHEFEILDYKIQTLAERYISFALVHNLI
ncbi:hypothetical protein COM40_11965 [Bacillus wiedmannii]|uniref:hypothetical protein n=1 Tax=Bacillus wiedmannii TaxID=1890302 RepID=UPI000BF70B86|nr:hypothetical protein [Bacillus wiedmannii]PGD58078.1 hypothetical protein COM40_11965 [Bacillus wiedmannii]